MKPTAAYLRCSTELQQLSISDQKKEILEYAGKMNFEVVRWFVDEGKSGVLTKGRPAFGEMTAMVDSEKHDFVAVLCYDVSRWGRFINEEESGHYRWVLSETRGDGGAVG